MNELDESQRQLIGECLAKVLRDPLFAGSGRLSGFLRYIVTETIEGRGARLKGYAIAVSVFDCAPNFDPQSNSIVRVEAIRLRKQLAAYYAGPGRGDPLEIRVDRGSYVPQFIHRDGPAVEDTSPELDKQPIAYSRDVPGPANLPSLRASVFGESNRSRMIVFGVAGVCLAGFLAFWAGVRPSPNRDVGAPAAPAARATNWKQAPLLAIAPLRLGTSGDFEAQQITGLTFDIAGALGRFDHLRVRGATLAPAPEPPDYVLEGSANRDSGGLDITFRLAAAETRQVIWTKTYRLSGSNSLPEGRDKFVAEIATTLGRNYGVIFGNRLRRQPALSESTAGYECLLHSYSYLLDPAQVAYVPAKSCLERSIAAQPRESLFLTAKSIVMIDGYLKGFEAAPKEAILEQALTAAHQAVELAPHSARAHLALARARFVDARFEDARASIRRALSLNPYSIEIRSRAGSMAILRGEYEEGLRLLDEVSAAVDNRASWLEFYHFLAHYMRGDMASANRFAKRAGTIRSPLGNLARIISAHHAGKHEAAGKGIEKFEASFPRFAGNVAAALDRHVMAEPIKVRLLGDYAAARAAALAAIPQ